MKDPITMEQLEAAILRRSRRRGERVIEDLEKGIKRLCKNAAELLGNLYDTDIDKMSDDAWDEVLVMATGISNTIGEMDGARDAVLKAWADVIRGRIHFKITEDVMEGVLGGEHLMNALGAVQDAEEKEDTDD